MAVTPTSWPMETEASEVFSQRRRGRSIPDDSPGSGTPVSVPNAEAADIFEHLVLTHGQSDVDGADIAGTRQHVLHRQLPVTVVIVDGASGQRDFSAATIDYGFTGPSLVVSSAAESVITLNTEPGSKGAVTARFSRAASPPAWAAHWDRRWDNSPAPEYRRCADPWPPRCPTWHGGLRTIFFTSRSATNWMRAVDGEANVLAGLGLALHFRFEAALLDIAGDVHLARAPLQAGVQLCSMPPLPF